MTPGKQKGRGMIKEEFRDLVGLEVSDEDYAVIEKVFQFHPSISEVSGKEEVAKLYKSFGMSVFYDMLPRAEKNCELVRQLRQAQAEADHIKQEMEKLTHGGILGREEAAMEMQEGHGIKEMLKLMDEMLTSYLYDPQVTTACKRRMKLCLVRRIEEIFQQFSDGNNDEKRWD